MNSNGTAAECLTDSGVTLEKPRPARLDSIDLLRGVVMILMALDHTRIYFTNVPFQPEDMARTNLPLFLMPDLGQRPSFTDTIGRKLAWILAGGELPHATTVSEQHLLDLEREAFLSLCGETKTQERMQYTLKTGKTLRN